MTKIVKKKRTGASTPRSHRKVHHTVSWAIVALWAVVGLLIGVAYNQKLLTLNPKPLSVTAPIDLGISDLHFDLTGQEPYKTPPGYKFAILTLTVTNHGGAVFNFAPVLQTVVQDGSGNKYEMSPAPLNNPIAAGPVSPGESRTGQLSYLVPSDTKALIYVFEDPQTHTYQQRRVVLRD